MSRSLLALVAGILCALVASGIAALASYQNPEGDSPGAATRAQQVAVAYAPPTVRPRRSKVRTRIEQMVIAEARAQGVNPALVHRIAYVESRFRSVRGKRTRYGRALGVMQVLPTTAERVEPGSSRHLLDPVVGIRVGVKYVTACIRAGAQTQAEVARCYVGGERAIRANLGGGRNGERYTRAYESMVDRAPAGENGWLAYGEGSLNVANLN